MFRVHIPPALPVLSTVRVRRYALGLAVFWTVALLSFFAWWYRDRKNDIVEIGRVEARTDFRKDYLFRRWGAMHGGVYVPASDQTPPNPYLAVPERDITTPSGKRLTLVNPAYMLRQLNELSGEQRPSHTGHITSLKPLRPENAPDRWEAAALKAFEMGKDEVSEVQQIDGRSFLRLMRPLPTEKACLPCHAPQGYRLGDIRGGISIAIPLAPFQAAFRKEMAGFAMALGAIWMIGLGLITVGARSLTGSTKALEASEEKYRALVTNVREVIFQTDTDGNWLFLNPAWEEITGIPVAACLGTDSADYVHPGDRFSCRADFRSLIERKKEHCQRELRFLTREGGVRWLMAHARAATGAAGDVTGVSGTLVDITERKEAEERFRSTFEQAAVGICHMAPDGTYIRVNRRWCDVVGYPPEALLSLTFQDITHPEDLTANLELAGQLIDGTTSVVSMEKRFIRKDLSVIWVNLTESLVRTPTGEPDYFIAVIEDISKRKRAEQALRESEKLLATIIDSEPECVKLLAADGTLELMNRSGLDMIQADSLDMVRGQSAYPLVAPAFRDAFAALTADVFQGKSGRLVFEMVGLKGRRLWLDTHAVPLRNDRGGIVSLLGITRDITEQRRAVEALRESEEHARQIFDQSSDGIVLFRIDTFKIIDANPAALRLFGVAREELAGLKLWNFIKPQLYRDFIRNITLDDDAREFRLDKADCYKKDGTPLIVSILGRILKLRDQYVIFCSIRDISEKIRLEGEVRSTQAKMIQTNKMTSLGMLVSSISHEINNPNNYISVNAAMLADVWRDAQPVLERFHRENGEFALGGLPFTEMQELAPRLFTGIAEGSHRINAIIKDMRDYVKDDKSGLQGVVDVNRLVRNAASILWHHIHKHTDSFHMELQDGLPTVRGNGQQVEQVIINLIMNALQSLPDKAAGVFVTASTAAAPGAVVVTVRDEGKGMSQKILKRLREPFFTTKLDEGGTGLGLYISDSIVREHKGSLEFDSLPGKGTTATVTLPAA